jgi:hypothetical protein
MVLKDLDERGDDLAVPLKPRAVREPGRAQLGIEGTG